MSNSAATNGSYELFNGKTVQQMASFEDELLSPPGGPACHPPVDQQYRYRMERLQQELLNTQQEATHQRQRNEELQRKLQQISYNSDHQLRYSNDDVLKETSQEQDLKDSQIRQLQRQLTILKAELYKKEQRIISDKETYENRIQSSSLQVQEALRTREAMMNHMKELENNSHLLQQVIDKLKLEGTTDKARIAQLEKMVRDLSSPPSSSSLQSLNSNPAYCQELEYLHKMVDILKMTVLEQRNTFIKMGLPARSLNSLQASSSSQSLQVSKTPGTDTNDSQVSIAATNASTPVIITTSVTSVPSVGSRLSRQPEEGWERTSNPSAAYAKPKASTSAAGSLIGGGNDVRVMSPGRDRSDVSNAVTYLTTEMKGLGVVAPSGGGNNLGEDGNDEIYVNVKASSDQNQMLQKSYQREQHNYGVPAQNMNTLNNDLAGVKTKTPTRKTSHSEIIRRPELAEASALPVRSRTELIGKNLHHFSQQQQEQENFSPHLFDNNTNIAPKPRPLPAGTRIALESSSIPGFAPTIQRPSDIQNPGLWAQENQQQHQYLTRSAISTTIPTSNNPPPIPFTNTADTTSRPNEGPTTTDDRLCCPVCNTNFSDDPMEEFQAHVFDCFDNENGPETLQPEMMDVDSPSLLVQGSATYRTCPMCQEKFEMNSITQSLFEQHVHRHFGEEAFEVLDRQ